MAHTSKGTISSPLASSATTLNPLTVSLDLSSLVAPSHSATRDSDNFFDQLDAARNIGVASDDTAAPLNRDGSSIEHHTVLPLVDSTAALFPSTAESLREASIDEPRPSWISNTSERVTALIATRVPIAPRSQDELAAGLREEEGKQMEGAASRLLVAAGTEAGSLWLFAPPPPPPMSALPVPQPTPPPSTHDSRRTSFSSLYPSRARSPPQLSSSPSSPPSGLSLPAVSPPTSPLAAGSKQAFPSFSNAPTSRKRHASVTPSSSASHPTRPPGLAHRNSSASLATRRSLSQAGGTETPHSHGQLSRLRKASATVSISPSMFSDFSSSPITTASSAPMSPSLSSASRTSYSRDWDAGSMKSPTMPAPSVTLSSPSPNRGHSKAKDSITTGIGLWESDSVAAQSLEDLAAPSLDDEEDSIVAEIEVPEKLEQLLPRLQARLDGTGAIMKMEVVQGLRLGQEEDGGVLVVLRRDGTLCLQSLIDGRSLGSCLASSGRTKDQEEPPNVGSTRKAALVWDDFQVLHLGESTVALLHSPSRLVVVDLDTLRAQESVSVATGPISVVTREGIHFLVYSPALPPAAPSSDQDSSREPTISLRPIFSVSKSHTSTTSQVNPPSALNGAVHSHSVPSTVQVRIDHSQSAGPLFGLLGSVCGLLPIDQTRLVAWSETGAVVFELHEQVVLVKGALKLAGITSVSARERKLLVSTETEIRLYELVTNKGDSSQLELILASTHPLSGTELSAALPASTSPSGSALQFLVARSQLATLAHSPSPQEDDEECTPLGVSRESIRSLTFIDGTKDPTTLYEARQMRAAEVVSYVTASVRLDRDRVILGYSSGDIRQLHVGELGHASGSHSRDHGDDSVLLLRGAITVLQVLEVEARQVLVAGSVDGSAGAWDTSDWSLIGQWNLFASPVSHLVCLWKSPDAAEEDPSASSSAACTLAFISANSPVALVSISLASQTSQLTSSLLFILPGTASPVESLSTDEGNVEILVIYQQGLARVCHIETRELRRSMDRKTAKGVLQEKEKCWTTWFEIGSTGIRGAGLVDPVLTLDLRSDLDDALRSLPWAGESKRPSKKAGALFTIATDGFDSPASGKGFASPASGSAKESLSLIRMLLSNLVTFGLDEDTDNLLTEHLGVERPTWQLRSAVSSSTSLSFLLDATRASAWAISPVATAQRLLQIVCLLRVFLNYPETERYASQAIVFFASFLQDAVGENFAFPSLDVLADYWLDKSNEVQQAARSLFGTYLGAASNARVLSLVERWQDLLPARQTGNGSLFGSADQALLVAGVVATERYKLLSSTILKDIALSVAQYLEDEQHPYHQAIATELCSRGFNIWQHYLDAMSLVRQLFGLATGRNPSTPNELRGLARQATLHVAGVNTPLFITTLLHDILDAPSATHRNATLKLLGFMIRKKPLVLYTSLPRIAEAVVKSLDPTVTALRETVHQAATVILNELVRTYPSIDFHHKSQRLAVGTHEGSTIIYDLKTATRLYVLEGHKRPVTALSWSPDGHRLVSVSLEESKAVVWKVALGILSMFMPGAPPRQGSGAATEPFKTFDFHVGAEAHMTNAATLEWVVFDWPAERTARLRIRETALNFGC